MYQSDPIDGQVEAVFPPVPSGYVHGSLWYGFKIVGDNLDKTIKPRDMRSNHQSQSLHYFNLYAALLFVTELIIALSRVNHLSLILLKWT